DAPGDASPDGPPHGRWRARRCGRRRARRPPRRPRLLRRPRPPRRPRPLRRIRYGTGDGPDPRLGDGRQLGRERPVRTRRGLGAPPVIWSSISLSALAAVGWPLLLVLSRRIGIRTLCHAVLGLGMAGLLALM